MPFVEQEYPYLNPFLCDVCFKPINSSGLLEHGLDVTSNSREFVYGYILCEDHLDTYMERLK